MTAHKRKKSLVGWIDKNWTTCRIDNPNIMTFGRMIPNLIYDSNDEDKTLIKVRITIEEIR